ncbi:MAG: hypothetical protein PHF86_04960 [Candidatus Nanoarchaeia archaeon]|jgi:hypothetical protein|nr:hypothetical protein [Candidatus Nanoarchaeia archaeon]
MNNAIATTNYLVPAAAVETFPDDSRYKCRFNVRSQSSNSLYRVSFDSAGGYWTCSCRGNIRHGSCKHLDSMGLKGRKYGRSRLEDAIKTAPAIAAPRLAIAHAA